MPAPKLHAHTPAPLRPPTPINAVTPACGLPHLALLHVGLLLGARQDVQAVKLNHHWLASQCLPGDLRGAIGVAR